MTRKLTAAEEGLARLVLGPPNSLWADRCVAEQRLRVQRALDEAQVIDVTSKDPRVTNAFFKGDGVCIVVDGQKIDCVPNSMKFTEGGNVEATFVLPAKPIDAKIDIKFDWGADDKA